MNFDFYTIFGLTCANKAERERASVFLLSIRNGVTVGDAVVCEQKFRILKMANRAKKST